MDDFDALPRHTREKIDRAFDRASSDFKSQRSEAHTPPAGGFIAGDVAPGGFLVDDAPGGFLPPDAGGFLPASPSTGGFLPPLPPSGGPFAPSSLRAHVGRSPEDTITLSEIAHGLQILDLPPDDEEVLSVFRKAASGWGAQRRSGEEEEREEVVTRKDWRSVCSALLGGDEGTDNVEPDEPDDMADIIEDEDVNMDAVESEGDASSDEYIDEAPQPKRKRGTTSKTSNRKTRQKKVELIDSDDDGDPLNRPLTARQKLECLHAFSLFFPGIDEDALKRRRIGIKEITQASNILKEKTTVEEVCTRITGFLCRH